MDSPSPHINTAANDPANGAVRRASLSTITPGTSKRRVIVVSNRVVKPQHEHVGGLGQALKSALAGSEGLWMGWSGETREKPSVHESTVGNMQFLVRDLTDEDYRCYYRGFSNSVMWPLLHARPDLMAFDPRDLHGYLAVNRHFARQLHAAVREDDIIWVHDYHLLPLAYQARELGVRVPLGLFLHTPVPAPATLSLLPSHQRLLSMLSAYDLIGVQTETDALNLRDYFEREHGARIENDGRVRLDNGRGFRVKPFPIGIDPDAVAALAANGSRADAGKRDDGIAQVIGVDRLDYTKGIPERLRCIDRLLRDDPQLQGRFRFLQVAPTSRGDVDAYRELADHVEMLVETINTRHCGADGWQPVDCVREALPLRKLAALYRGSKVGLVTPLRDGMNLVAKEYVAAQDPADPGVLVLSSFAGAASELDAALLVNPYDVYGTAHTVARAIAMPKAERRERWQAMMRVIRQNDIHAWSRSFLRQLREARTPARPVAAGRLLVHH